MHEVWITNGNGTKCFIVGGLTRAEALIVKENIEYGIDVAVWVRPEPVIVNGQIQAYAD